MSHHSRSSLTSLVVLTLLITTACAPASPPTTPTTPPSTATSLPPTATPNPSGKVDVGGYQLFYQCFGEGTPTVIVEAGLGNAPTVDNSWIYVTPEIQKITRICIYDRAGIGNSDKAPTPRTSKDSAEDLHRLLRKIPLPGPFILVGHSIGGFHVRLFAQLYPQEVAGIILVDSAHPDQFSQWAVAFPTVAPNEDPYGIASERKNFTVVFSPEENPEGFDWIASAEQVRNAGSLGSIPLIVLSESPDRWQIPHFTAEDNQRFAQIWQNLQADLATLSTNSTHVTAKTGGHDLQKEEPKVVIDAITQMVQEIRNR